MSVSIIKGQKADVTKGNTNVNQVVVGMGWRTGGSVELDFSTFLLRADGKVERDEDLIFYSNPTGAAGSVTVKSQNEAYGGITDQAQVSIKLRQVPHEIERIAFSLTVYDGEQRRQNFGMVEHTYIRIMDEATGTELLRYDIDNNFSVETAVVVGELYKYKSEWKFSAVGSGYKGGLSALCTSFGIEVKDEPSTTQSTPTPAATTQSTSVPSVPSQSPPATNTFSKPTPPPTSPPPPPTAPPSAAPVNIGKIELKKRGDSINLQKNASGSLGELLINLNWNQKQASGWFGALTRSRGVDLDLGCLYELKDGQIGVIQPLGKQFGSYNRAPFISLDGDDRIGTVKTGENLRINGTKLPEFRRILIFTLLYEGASNWAEADGVVTLKQTGGPDIIVRLDEHDNRRRVCAIAMLENVSNQTFNIKKIVEYFSDNSSMDRAFNWGLRWVPGSK
ncbi:TerD family protein [Paenibacillus sp. 481]|uniref:TerD family protein n=1 Tax=Paenibacillus sp. 481 TaxID=2835869 RepID=UPI001E58BFC8|nr:TerD family protein [Paenibacillus sp. 481]UHA74801.1 TerD domain-containing protein [Paenibacillus sp. 481]